MNFHEGPLILFTVLAQGAIGAFWWCFIALMFCKLPMDKQVSLRRSMLILWVMMGVAFLFSTFHLGHPFRAMNSLLKTGQAALSNEIVAAALFAGFGALCWLTGIKQGVASMLHKALLVITLVCSFLLLLAIPNVYQIPTVPMWATGWTTVSFIATALIFGSAVAALLLAFTKSAETPILKCGPLLFAGVGVLIALIAAVAHLTGLQGLEHFPLKDAQGLIEGINYWMVVRLILLFVGLALWICTRAKQCAGAMLIVAAVLMFAEMAGRLIFYSMNMTVGLI